MVTRLLQGLVSTNVSLLHIDRDSVLSSKSWDISLLSCGAVIEAIDAVMKGNFQNSFCAVRPPGHHAGIYGKTM